MQCISPISLKGKSAALRRTNQVPCGRCVPCLERRRNDWSIRLSEELKQSSSALFLTFTYSDEFLPYSEETGEPTLNKTHLPLFLKKLRKNLSSGVQMVNHFGRSVKTPKIDVKLVYFVQGEYGTQKDRPHYHMLLFNFPQNMQYMIEKSWSMGFVHFGEVNAATIHYTTKYMITKYDSDFDGRQKPFALMSKGIGKIYVTRNTKWHKSNQVPTFTQFGGVKYPLPRYYKDKIFDEIEKQKISAKNISYSERQKQNEHAKLLNQTKDELEAIRLKHERLKNYLSLREKFLNKSKL